MTSPQISQKVGPLVSPWTLEQAAVATLQKWLWPTFMEELERQNGLAYGTLPQIAAPQIRGAADLDEWMRDELPVVLVVSDRAGTVEHYTSNGDVATYPLTIGSVVAGYAPDEEHLARRNANLITAACMGAIGEQLVTDHPGLIVDVRMMDPPHAQLPDADIRLLWTAEVMFEVVCAPVLDQTLGLDTPDLPGSAPSGYPTVQTTDLTLTAVPDDQSINGD